jgi:membrane protease subunit (stomatin/prohibitin family)
MGILSFAKKQFIEVIEWTESEDGVLAFHYPIQDNEIKNGAQLTVRESQLALFVNEGQVADVFEPGRYSLTTKNLPILTNLKNWDKAFASPFKADVFFFSTRTQIDQKWGTATPITIRDKEFGPIRIRAHGAYSYKVKNPKVFFKTLSGTTDVYTTDNLDGQLRSIIMTSLGTFFGSAEVGFVDMAANQAKFSQTLKEALSLSLTQYGLSLEGFQVVSISLPDELQKYLDQSSSMHLVGDLRKYAQFQAAEAIGTAAKQEGGIAGAGVGLSAGLSVGQAMAQAFGPAGVSGTGAAGGGEDPVAILGKLHELLTKGVITQAEFDAKKSELLKKIT